ncbi:PREDICTED: zingipain-2-like [Nanorana parkeri]|uniref:zingipain-2-like n=1 Tax=Nanorana parkeri TaxID=125878 RepID=UPI0008548195|nr:PREDICTED: zingipain-2-like [Nanorana parkeri]
MHLDKYLLVLSAVIICVSSSRFLNQEWSSWKTKYEKKYVTSYDEAFRRQAWEATWHKVQNHNQKYEKGLTKYRMEMNHFADMTTEERNSRNCISNRKKSTLKSNIPLKAHSKDFHLPPTVDWRESKCVTNVKNQGLCGSCWAFATVGVIETQNCIKSKQLVELSEQQFVDCDSTNDGCCGGIPAKALDYVTHYGVMKAKDYEYSEKQSACMFKNDDALKFNVSKFYVLLGEENMASSLALDGPITVGIDASEDFQLYKDGIFTGECTEQPTHAVIIVGYGTEYDKEEGAEIDYWIIKNSWGESWGEKGYAKMQRNVNLCGITSMAASVDFV